MNTLFSPFSLGRRFNVKFLAAGQLIILLGLWIVAPASTGIPSPLGVLSAWNELATTKGMLLELGTSISTITQALVLSSLISWLLSSLVTADIFKPIGNFVSALRFLGFAGLTFLFTLWTDSPHGLKLSLLTFGMTVFLTRSMIDVVKSVPQSEIDYARTLGLSGWGLTWELMVRGRSGDMLDLIRQNAAVGWTLLAMVEGITRSEGGIGAMLLNSNKYFNMNAVFAIQLTILSYGIAQDYALSALRSLLCPWTRLNRSDK
jgi:ABC-type nitrate/sulfonate/bicarbonate transport system permease component